MAKETNAVDTEKYAGPSKPGQAFVVGSTWGAAGFVAAVTTGLVGIGKTFLDTARQYTDGGPTKGLKGSTLIIAAVVMTPVAFVIGSVRGWLHAGKAQTQFDALKSERDVARMRAEAAEGSLQKVSNAMQQTQERFNHINRMVKEREAGGAGSHPKSHADKHESRGEQGSHAAAALADKAQAEHAERTH